MRSAALWSISEGIACVRACVCVCHWSSSKDSIDNANKLHKVYSMTFCFSIAFHVWFDSIRNELATICEKSSWFSLETLCGICIESTSRIDYYDSGAHIMQQMINVDLCHLIFSPVLSGALLKLFQSFSIYVLSSSSSVFFQTKPKLSRKLHEHILCECSCLMQCEFATAYAV